MISFFVAVCEFTKSFYDLLKRSFILFLSEVCEHWSAL